MSDEESGVRLDEFLARHLGGISRMRIARLISAGRCSVNSAMKEAGIRVFAGDLVELRDLDLGPSAMTPEQIPLDIVYEDDHIMVVVKPAGMLVHPTIGVKSGTLSNALAFHLNRDFYSDQSRTRDRFPDIALPSLVRPGIVHRLDRATSGLIAIAKTPHSLTVLTRHFRRGLVKKRYLAVIRGCFDTAEGSIIAPIGRDPDRRPHWGVMGTGKPAETRWRVLAQAEDVTLLELEPVTGRTNQLRIHLAYAGRPVLGDLLYGPAEGLECADDLKTPYEAACSIAQSPAEPGRLLLHAWRLAFHHPQTGEWRQFTSRPPVDFAPHLLEVLRDAEEPLTKD